MRKASDRCSGEKRAVYHRAVTCIRRVSAMHRRCGQERNGAAEMDISDWRQKIDELDEQIVQLISRRAEAAKAIGELKHGAKLPVYEPGREQAVFDHVCKVNPGTLPDAEILHIYERIIDVMRSLQRRDL
jgi:chorismate mutase